MSEPTADPTVWIENQRPGYVRYVSDAGQRWEVHGTCVRLGYCLLGANIRMPDGSLIEVQSLAHLADLQAARGTARLDSELDVPVGPGFTGCCDLRVTEL